ncbi:hypothetical protein Leryth_006115 [Lithospermum erythrorhizon]|nr:hypothetical protein Leryth_006115 [Lithospermum erythrorhizon]
MRIYFIPIFCNLPSISLYQPLCFYHFSMNIFSFLIMFMFLINLAFNDSISDEVNLGPCLSGNCSDGLIISYPFWIQGMQESTCGLPGFNITCDHKKPILKLSGDDYVVKDIVYANKSIWLAKVEALDDQNNCPLPMHNFSIEGSPFNYGPETDDLYFFLNCSRPYRSVTFSVDCASNATHYAFADFHPEVVEHNNYSLASCLPPVKAPVLTESLKILLNMTYREILKKGFVLQWDGNSDKCSSCQKRGNRLNWRLKVGIAFGAAILGAAAMCMIVHFCQHMHKTHKTASLMGAKDIFTNSTAAEVENAETGIYYGVYVFNYDELKEATNKFDASNALGDGGFSTVYKGKLKDGRVVAIKRLYENNYKRVELFMNEIEILTRLHHQNLVTLYGCTSYRCQELLLVYEYISNGTVADHLHGEQARPGSLSWTTRLDIAIETASALTYLHAIDVIHRDVKTNNILLDEYFRVKVADFGLSRLFPSNATHVSTAPQGTPGYVDPEYQQCYHLTDRSDVYSFGVVLFELISSKPAVDITRDRSEITLANMAISKIQKNVLDELVDPCLEYQSDLKVKEMITEVAELAYRCLQGSEMRPSMAEILEDLQRIRSNESGSITKADDVLDIPISTDFMLLRNEAFASPESGFARNKSWKANASV